jgi:competence protein ComEA
VAALLLALAARPEPRGRGDCADPREAAARAGHSVAVACGAPASGRALRGPARRLFALPIDLGTADAPTLETLPGIGPARAEAILRERARAPFAAPEELERVPGIGPRTVAGLLGLVAVGGGE